MSRFGAARTEEDKGRDRCKRDELSQAGEGGDEGSDLGGEGGGEGGRRKEEDARNQTRARESC
jgi:hypothetical protein